MGLDTERAARKLIRSARRRAPSFVLLTFIFNQELEQWTDCEDTRELIRADARRILAEERDSK